MRARTGGALVMIALFGTATDAQARIVPVARAEGPLVALSGERVVWAAVGRSAARVRTAPAEGGRPIVRFTERLRRGSLAQLDGLEASPEKVSFGLSTERRGFRVFAQGAHEPFSPVAGPATLADLDGSTLAIREGRGYTIVPHSGPRVRLSGPFPSELFALAGAYVAYPIDEDATRVAVVNWRSGVRRYVVAIPGDRVFSNVTGIDLAPDGRLVAATDDDERTDIYMASSTGSLRRVLTDPLGSATSPRFAGQDTLVVRRERPHFEAETLASVSLATGAIKNIGIPTTRLESFDAAGGRVAWSTDDCVYTARLTDGVQGATPAGPCPRSEAVLGGEQDARAGGRRLKVKVRCITAAGGVCRGVVTLRDDEAKGRLFGSARFRVPAGQARRVRVRLSRRRARQLRRWVKDFPQYDSVELRMRATAIDREGRRSRDENALFISPPRTRPRR